MSFNVLNGTKFRAYITVDGDRYDTIADKAWGDPTKFPRIIEANYGVPLSPVLKGGIVFRIPILAEESETNQDLLPPWKRVPAASTEQAKASVPLFTNPSTSLGGSFDDSFD